MNEFAPHKDYGFGRGIGPLDGCGDSDSTGHGGGYADGSGACSGAGRGREFQSTVIICDIFSLVLEELKI